METTTTLNELQQLSALLTDSMTGFGQIAERSVSERYKELMREYEKESMFLLEDLNREIIYMGGEINTSSTMENAINNLWLNLKPTLLQFDVKNVLKNILSFEESNIQRYEEVINSDMLPEGLKERLSEHRTLLTERLAEIRNLIRVAEL